MAFGLEIFSNDESQTLVNPRWSEEQRRCVLDAAGGQALRSHFWIASSGTESFRPNSVKMVGISKRAFLVAADSVCKTLSIGERDVYYNSLPLFHVGGLSTLARAVVSGCSHVQADEHQKWDARAACERLKELKVTVTSLVPTQIFDIVSQSLSAPSALRFVFVGGGALSDELASRALSLGWNLVPTYGMTETAAMMAYKKESTQYTLFPHIAGCRTNVEGRLEIRSEALFTGYLFVDENGGGEFVDPKRDGWFTAGDRAQVVGDRLELEGRETELVKIKGESVSLLDLNLRFENYCLRNGIGKKSVVLALPEERDGYLLCVVSEGEIAPHHIEAFNQTLLPFARLTRAVCLEKLPLTALGKVDIAATRRQI